MSMEERRIKIAKKELEDERAQWLIVIEQAKDLMSQLEAAPKTMREFVQEVADTIELRVKSEEVLETVRFFALQAIHRFQVVPTLEEAITCYANLLHFIGDLIPPDMYVKHMTKLKNITENEYGMIWKEQIQLGRRVGVSRIVMQDVFTNFYELVRYLLRLRFLTADDAEQTFVSFAQAEEVAKQRAGKK